MNEALELHDSRIVSASLEGGILTIRLEPAYIHSSAGSPGVDEGDGFIQRAELVFIEANPEGSLEQISGLISDGFIETGDESYSLLPLPFDVPGPVEARFIMTNGMKFTVKAGALKCFLSGNRQWVEKFGG